MLKAIALILLLYSKAFGKDFGTKGAMFPIVEEGFVYMIERRLKNIDIPKHQKLIQEKAKKQILNPKGFYLPRATRQRSYLVDPTFELKEDIKLPDGKLLYAKGTKVNPLDQMPLDKKIILLDGEDQRQIKWLQDLGQNESDVVILTNGSPIALSDQLNRPIYFDQYKQFTSKFSIDQLPAVVSQENKLIRVLICQI